jgi:hypothetical protein
VCVGLQALFYFSTLKNKKRKNKNVLANGVAVKREALLLPVSILCLLRDEHYFL